MTSIVSKSSYRRLKQEVIFEEEDHHHHHHHHHHHQKNKSKKERLLDVIKRSSSSVRLRSSSLIRWMKIRSKFRIKVGGFRRFFRIRRKNKLKVARLSWANKVYKRLKESQSHFGDLFSGNYLFMQVTPSSFNHSKIYVSSQHPYNHNSNFKFSAALPSTYNTITNNNYALEKVS